MINRVVTVAADAKDLLGMSPATADAILSNCRVKVELAQPREHGDVKTVLPLKAFTVGPEDIFAATDKAHALALANAITKPVPAYCIEEVEPVEAKYLAQPWGESKETLQQRLEARTEPGYFAGWQE